MRKRILKEIRIKEVASVDAPAHGAGARAVLMKRTAVDDDELAKQAMLTAATDGHTHLVQCASYDGERYSGDTSGANTSSGQYHTHPWVMDEDGNVSIGENLAHAHEMGAMSKAFPKKKTKKDGGDAAVPDEEDEETKKKGGKLAPPFKKSEGEQNQPAEDLGEGTNMSDAKGAAVATEADKLKAAEQKSTELEKRLAKADALSALTDAEKAFAGTLPEGDERDEFTLGKTEDRKARMAKAIDANPVVYKSTSGDEYRKNDDLRMVAMAKRNDQLAKGLAEAELEKRGILMKKQAETDLRFLPGDVDTKVELLKAVHGIEDQATRTKVIEMCKAQNAEMAKAYDKLGTSAVPAEGLGEVEAMAKRIQADKKVTYEKALAIALSTPEGQKAALQGVR